MDKVSFDDTLIRDRYMEPRVKSSTLVVFAFLQIMFGGILIFMGFVAINIECSFAYTGMPIYAGVLVIITGLIGIVSALKKTDQMTLTSLVFSFLSATFCAVALVIVMAVALYSEDYWSYSIEGLAGTNHVGRLIP
ncbi:transmembrane protein 212-like [Ptychodera flava]|uniref:transmembrane protein 212-like n=1 Tax=Ptychodera flava TaxID=63121 RepID=UPI00396A9C56